MNTVNESVVRQLWSLFSEQKWDESKLLFDQDFIAEWPQSRERFRGAEAFVEMNRAYPGTHRIEPFELISNGNRVVSTVFIHAQDTGQKAFATSWFHFRNGKIALLTEFWGEPYDAPENRKQWAEKY